MKYIMILLLTLSVRADFMELLEQEIFVHVSNTLASKEDVKSFKISEVSYIDMDRNAEYYVQAKWSEVSKDGSQKNCEAEYFLSDFNREDFLIEETLKSCK